MTNLHLTLPDYLVIGGYFAIVLWAGFYFRMMASGFFSLVDLALLYPDPFLIRLGMVC